MKKHIMVNLKMISFKVKENIYGIMAKFLSENGIKVNLVNLESLFGLMVVIILVSIKAKSVMEEEYFNGVSIKFGEEVGLMV